MADQVVVGATKRDLVVTILDESGNVVDLTGGSARLQGRSSTLPENEIDVAGVLTDPAQGVVTFAGIGTYVTTEELATLHAEKATFRLRVKFTDASAEFDYGDLFEIEWWQDPLVLVGSEEEPAP